MLPVHSIRVMVADDHEVVLAGLKTMISRHRNLDYVGGATNGAEAVNLAIRLRPDVAIVDITMPSCDGLEVTRRLGKESPETNVLVFSMREHASMVLAALQAGALGYASKRSSHEVIIGAISVVAAGKRFIDPRLSDSTLRMLLDDHPIGERSTLTRREREVLLQVAWGFTNSDIGIELGISTKTVESYRARACEKLALSDRPAIVQFVLKSGWLDEEAG
ncbi:MAG: response regulator transcription factor [Acidobacteriia bacterium]|nr:response regulator transcription factor [Terriglobia bacterium]